MDFYEFLDHYHNYFIIPALALSILAVFFACIKSDPLTLSEKNLELSKKVTDHNDKLIKDCEQYQSKIREIIRTGNSNAAMANRNFKRHKSKINDLIDALDKGIEIDNANAKEWDSRLDGHDATLSAFDDRLKALEQAKAGSTLDAQAMADKWMARNKREPDGEGCWYCYRGNMTIVSAINKDEIPFSIWSRLSVERYSQSEGWTIPSLEPIADLRQALVKMYLAGETPPEMIDSKQTA